jgi:agmatine deiminase
MQKFLFLLALLALEACQQTKPSEQPAHYHQAAEFEPSEAIWLLWSNYNHRADLPNEQATLDIINALVPHVKVKLVVANDSVYQYARRKIRPDLLEKQQVSIFKLPFQEFWARDMGPSFVLNQAGQLAMADFNFNAWGTGSLQDSVVKMDESLDERVAKLMKLPIVSTPLITEGGNHEVNGKGVLMLTETVERGRNPKLSLTQIEKEYQRVLGIKKVIWLKEGLHEDDHTHRGTHRSNDYRVQRWPGNSNARSASE